MASNTFIKSSWHNRSQALQKPITRSTSRKYIVLFSFIPLPNNLHLPTFNNRFFFNNVRKYIGK